MKVGRKLKPPGAQQQKTHKPPGAQQQKTHFGGPQKLSISEASIEME